MSFLSGSSFAWTVAWSHAGLALACPHTVGRIGLSAATESFSVCLLRFGTRRLICKEQKSIYIRIYYYIGYIIYDYIIYNILYIVYPIIYYIYYACFI